MRFQFAEFLLDTGRGSLTGPSGEIKLDRKAWLVLNQLIEHRGSVVSKEDLIDTCWDGRAVSDAAVSSVIKSIRRALDDDGVNQSLLRTIRGRGFRFETEVRISALSTGQSLPEPERFTGRGKPKIAVLPLRSLDQEQQNPVMGEAIAAELIGALSRFRWLSVVARGSSFRFREGTANGAVMQDVLGAQYAITGTVERFSDVVAVWVELSTTSDDTVLWADRIEMVLDKIPELRARVVASVISALNIFIVENEARTAEKLGTENLDAWGAYHLGLFHLNRYTQKSNGMAKEYFKTATHLDPQFSGAYAAWALARFQDAFQGLDLDRSETVSDALRLSERSIELDPQNCDAHYANGRAQWLAGRAHESLLRMDSSLELNPNHAVAFYYRGFCNLHSGSGISPVSDVAEALRLSPVDPMAFGMCATYAKAKFVTGDLHAALEWAERGAGAVNAHHLPVLVAAAIAELTGFHTRAENWRDKALEKRPDATISGFLDALPMGGGELATKFSKALRQLGLP